MGNFFIRDETVRDAFDTLEIQAQPAAAAKAMRERREDQRKASKNRDYLGFIHELPCCITGRYGVEAAHLSFAMPRYGHYGRGKQRKVSDRWALPLCPEEHSRQHSMSEEAYWRGRSPHVLALTLYGLWCDLGDDAVPFATAIINQHTEGKP